MSDLHTMLVQCQARLDQFEADRRRLTRALGVSDADSIIAMVQSLEAQLNDLYALYGDRLPQGEADIEHLLEYVKGLSTSLDNLFGIKSITLELDGQKPGLRATWQKPRDPDDGDGPTRNADGESA